MSWGRTLRKGLSAALVIALGYVMNSPAAAAQEVWRFDCGTADSPVMAGFQPLTADDAYSPAKGFGWEGVKPQSIEFQNPGPLRPHTRPREVDFDENLTDLNRDAVKSTEDLVLRVDVPNGRYRVRLLFGDMTQAVGSVDVHVNGKLAATRATAWTPGGYRSFIRDPYGWWAPVRHTAVVDDGMIRIRLSKNQSYYDEQMVEQSPWESPFKIWWPAAKNIPPYFYIGYPFIHNSLMAVEIAPLVRPPVIGQDGRLKLIAEIDSPALRGAISSFNIGDLDTAAASLARVTKPDAQVAKAVVALWLAGHPDAEMEKTLVPEAIRILGQHVRVHPEETVLAEYLQDAEYFQKALTTHLTRGYLADEKGRGKNHFIENDRAIGWWWLIGEDSPLYYTSQLYIARAGHMLRPYMPTLGTEAEILKKLEKKFPDNRYVRYLLHWEWEPVGDGSRFEDWYMVDYSSKAKDSPDWVREQYPALASLVDWAEWFFKFKQRPEGTIGGGWGDDVEIVGAFGYTGYVGRGVSDLAIQGAGKLVDGMWNLSEVDPELGFCLALADAEHTAEWTGNTLGMMVVIDYGNPVWLERSMKTGKLLRDLWTDYDVNGHRHFRANFFSAAQVGADDQANDSWINYRAIAPASAVLWYNQSPAISKVLVELADAWRAAAMSTARGKPRGIIPAEISFPQGIIGGMNSPNWYTASHPPGTVNHDWAGPQGQRYKNMIQNLLITGYEQTADTKYLEPLRIEYELKHASVVSEGGKDWVAKELKETDKWLQVQRMLAGREGGLENRINKGEIIKRCRFVNEKMKLRWPLMTTEASATDRVAFPGWAAPLMVATGARWSDRYMVAAITYENTTKDFAAALMATDSQGFRLLYYSLTDDTREIGIVPWELEPSGKYRLRYGPDANEDELMDSVVEEREFVLPQRGTPIRITVAPGITYAVEVEQLERGTRSGRAPDPGLSAEDIRFVEERNLILARIHNVGSEAVRGVAVSFYAGDPEAGGELIGTALIPNIEPPNDLEPRTVTVGVHWSPPEEPQEIYVVVDPDDEIKNEITTFNNVAHTTLPKAEEPSAPAKKVESLLWEI